MNLIHDKWIPVRRKNGEKIKIAPWQITEDMGTNKEITELAAPRPDFNGAHIQFLIGLLQTTCAPQNIGEWRTWLNKPPSPDELKQCFEKVAFAFNIDGDGPRFMQEIDLSKDNAAMKDPWSIDQLLIEMPGDNTIKQNIDHFIKRKSVEQICTSCMATVLFTLLTNAPGGGQGHLTGLRGGGPLTTLIYGNTIWETAWLNILEESKFDGLANTQKIDKDDKFPWWTNKRNSKKGLITTPEDVNPAQLFWATPRPVFVLLETSEQMVLCDLCGGETNQIAKQYLTKTKGVDYKGAWRHPLSPMCFKIGNKKKNESDMWLPVHQHECVGYKHWLGYVLNDNKHNPALVVSDLMGNKMIMDFRLWAFGYDMDKMKARCWHEGIMPVVLVEEKFREVFAFFAANIIRAAEKASNDIAWHVKDALCDVKIEANKRKNFDFVKSRFWQETEPEFYKILNGLRDFIMSSLAGSIPEDILNGWLKHLGTKAEEIFDDTTQSGQFDAVDPGRIAKAWNKLKLKLHNDEMKQTLGLPFAPKPIISKKEKKQKV